MSCWRHFCCNCWGNELCSSLGFYCFCPHLFKLNFLSRIRFGRCMIIPVDPQLYFIDGTSCPVILTGCCLFPHRIIFWFWQSPPGGGDVWHKSHDKTHRLWIVVCYSTLVALTLEILWNDKQWLIDWKQCQMLLLIVHLLDEAFSDSDNTSISIKESAEILNLRSW